MSATRSNLGLAPFTGIAIALAFVVNVISNLAPLNGQSVGELSNTLFRDILITPANYAFAIWGLIYIALFSLAIFQLRRPLRNDAGLAPVRWGLIIASICQCAWIYLFLARLFVGSLLAMVGIWIALLAGYLALANTKAYPRKTDWWCLKAPISLYFGWISVATIVNVAIALFSLGWTGGGISPQLWTQLLMAIATLIGGIVLLRHQDLVFAGVVVWALVAIALRHSAVPGLLTVGLVGAGVLCALGLYSRWQIPRRR
jgi:hypothetical protein